MQYSGYAIAPKLVILKRKKIRFLYREAPDNSQDSGWRVFSGEEDQAYVDNPNNLGLYSLGTLLEIDPDIAACLEAPIGSAFERGDTREPFSPSNFEIPKEGG